MASCEGEDDRHFVSPSSAEYSGQVANPSSILYEVRRGSPVWPDVDKMHLPAEA